MPSMNGRNRMWNDEQDDEAERLLDEDAAHVLLFADEHGVPLSPIEDDEIEYGVCLACKSSLPIDKLRRGEDDERYCDWCYDSTGQDPGALQGIDPEN